MNHHPETAWNLAALFFRSFCACFLVPKKSWYFWNKFYICVVALVSKNGKKSVFYNFLFFSMRSMPQCPKWNSLLVLQGFLTNHETVPGQPSE